MTKKLEVRLGPDTADLKVRVGIHSGPVTGGVLRGERSRFQLFGDTMNTTARIESTGEAGKIHISQATADLIVSAGKTQWLTMRAEKISTKGKGKCIVLLMIRNISQSSQSLRFRRDANILAKSFVQQQR